jgi:hypothetical protein
MKFIPSKVTREALENAECIVCGWRQQIGTYMDYPVCFPCYESGRLRKWIDELKPETRKIMGIE